MLRVAIVGCGKIADQHADQIIHVPGCEIVGVCDREELMAQQLQERLNVPFSCTDVRDLVEHARPDVVHITTPPQSHYALGKLCLEAGCHIYVEKPFTTDLCEAEELIGLAIRENRKMTVGHNAQFSHAAARMRQLVADGYLGGVPLHMEAYYCYDLSDASYARAMLGDQHHWVRALPGGLLQNTISHGICKIAEFMTEDNLRITARGFTSSTLKSLGENSIIDELRVIIQCDTTTAYFTFSSQMKPSLHQLRLYGPKNGLIVDEQQQTVIKLNGARHKSYLEQFVPPWNYAQQYVGNALGNMHKFFESDFHTNIGMRRLIRAFYESISSNEPLPIPYDEILRTSRIMEEIFSQLSSRASSEARDLRECALVEAACDQ
jgi:predicted dehydrogenase